jgi:hypothetical protein
MPTHSALGCAAARRTRGHKGNSHLSQQALQCTTWYDSATCCWLVQLCVLEQYPKVHVKGHAPLAARHSRSLVVAVACLSYAPATVVACTSAQLGCALRTPLSSEAPQSATPLPSSPTSTPLLTCQLEAFQAQGCTPTMHHCRLLCRAR